MKIDLFAWWWGIQCEAGYSSDKELAKAAWDASAKLEREACATRIEPKNHPSDWTEYAKIRAECAAQIRGINMRDEYQCDFRITERDKKLFDYAERYHTECEAYDRTVCTGQIIDGAIMPMTTHEMALICRNAQSVRKRILFDAERDGIPPEDVTRAISKWDGK